MNVFLKIVGKHEERNDQHGYVTQEYNFALFVLFYTNYISFFLKYRFRRRMSIPEGVNPESVTSTLSPGGVLTILAPKMCVEGKHQS